MKLYKADTSAWTVREIEGEPWPGRDADGDTCYENTHFVSEDSAWDRLRAEAEAFICLSGRSVHRCQDALREAEREAGRACEAFSRVMDGIRHRPAGDQQEGHKQ